MEAGLDEAGRGPVVGPLVVGLVATDRPRRMSSLGVKDSKVLTPARREALDEKIRGIADRVELVEIPAEVIDQLMKKRTLNEVEMDAFAELGRRVEAATYYLDACDVDETRFGAQFLARLLRPPPPPTVVSRHRADATYPLVSAASIVAKVRRDARIREIAERLEPEIGLPLGSGYAHDEATIAFLTKYLEIHERLPVEARASWATAQTLNQRRWQRSLAEF